MSACCYRWRASRVEVDTAPVEHVCCLPRWHDSDTEITVHYCSCGAQRAAESGWIAT